MKFKVASGKVKDCVQDAHGNWVTPNKGWLVKTADGILLKGCEEYVEPPTDADTKTVIKAYLDKVGIAYTSAMTKNELLALA